MSSRQKQLAKKFGSGGIVAGEDEQLSISTHANHSVKDINHACRRWTASATANLQHELIVLLASIPPSYLQPPVSSQATT
jgi:hypothetical protein